MQMRYQEPVVECIGGGQDKFPWDQGRAIWAISPTRFSFAPFRFSRIAREMAANANSERVGMIFSIAQEKPRRLFQARLEIAIACGMHVLFYFVMHSVIERVVIHAFRSLLDWLFRPIERAFERTVLLPIYRFQRAVLIGVPCALVVLIFFAGRWSVRGA